MSRKAWLCRLSSPPLAKIVMGEPVEKILRLIVEFTGHKVECGLDHTVEIPDYPYIL
jgi:hypothetical protein